MTTDNLYIVHFSESRKLFAYSNGKQKLLGYQKLERLLKSSVPNEEDFFYSIYANNINFDTVIWVKPMLQIQQEHPEYFI